MSFSLAENRRMAAALLYLQATSLAGAIRLRLKRLRQPKYLLGALFFLLYFGLVFGRPAWEAQHMPVRHLSPNILEAIASLYALALCAWTLFSWLFPGARATLRFSESETAFLCPAPLSRVGLINFSLLRAQLGIFVSAFLLSLLLNRGRGLPGSAFQHATAIWLAIATMRLHSLGASFTVARFLEHGDRPWLRRMLAPALVLLLVAAALLWLATSAPPPPRIESKAGLSALLPWFIDLLHLPPLGIALVPFHWLARPMVAAGPGWWMTLLPPLALVVLHYLWVLRANVAFEEASIDAAAKRALQAANVRAGKWPWSRGQRKANNEPFALAGKGSPELAFLWSGLIGAGGGLWRPRVVGAIVLGTLLGVAGLAASPWARFLPAVASVGMMGYGIFVLAGAMMMQGRLNQILELLDIYKAGPLLGRQIALGQLLTPAALAAFGQWFGLLLAVACTVAAGKVDPSQFSDSSIGWAAAFGGALLGPLLCALLMCIPFAWILWFPAWAASLGARGGGFEAASQRMMFGFVYMIAAALALLPALALGGLVAWAGSALGMPASVSMLVVSLVAAVVLVLELAAIVRVLGARIDRLDVSTELR
jgi:hypothetical protein